MKHFYQTICTATISLPIQGTYPRGLLRDRFLLRGELSALAFLFYRSLFPCYIQYDAKLHHSEFDNELDVVRLICCFHAYRIEQSNLNSCIVQWGCSIESGANAELSLFCEHTTASCNAKIINSIIGTHSLQSTHASSSKHGRFIWRVQFLFSGSVYRVSSQQCVNQWYLDQSSLDFQRCGSVEREISAMEPTLEATTQVVFLIKRSFQGRVFSSGWVAILNIRAICTTLPIQSSRRA